MNRDPARFAETKRAPVQPRNFRERTPQAAFGLIFHSYTAFSQHSLTHFPFSSCCRIFIFPRLFKSPPRARAPPRPWRPLLPPPTSGAAARSMTLLLPVRPGRARSPPDPRRRPSSRGLLHQHQPPCSPVVYYYTPGLAGSAASPRGHVQGVSCARVCRRRRRTELTRQEARDNGRRSTATAGTGRLPWTRRAAPGPGWLRPRRQVRHALLLVRERELFQQ